MFIKKLRLLTNDLVSTEKFYTKILELTVLNKSETHISFSVGHTILSFSITRDKKPYYHFAFRIPSNKVDEAHSYISERTTVLPFTGCRTIADFTNWNAHAFYFHDNQQNILEFIAHHGLPNTSDQPFTSSSIIAICEIGVPVENVTEACKSINEEFEIPYFKKGPILHDFSVMGDEHGLFIVTKLGRGWVPTQQPSQRHFTEIEFENKNKERKFIIENE